MGGRAFDKGYRIATTKQQESNKQRQTDLQRKIRSLLLLAVSGGALIATPAVVQAEITPNPAAPNFLASGAETTAQAITEDNALVTTDDSFSVTVGDGIALSITGNGALVYNDANGSGLVTTAAQAALFIQSNGDAGGTPASVTVTTNGNISGGSNGIQAHNYGSGDVTVTATGTVEGEGERGISAIGYYSGDNVTVTANEVTGGQEGIVAHNYGYGNTSVTVTGTVTGTANEGIYAQGAKYSQDISVTAVDVSGGTSGIRTQNNGSGDTTITATGTVTGTNENGVRVINEKDTNDLTVEVNNVTGAGGIYAGNGGNGSTTIKSIGTVTSTADEGTGISVNNGENTTGLTVEVNNVNSVDLGISTQHNGTGNSSIKAIGTVTSTAGNGIYSSVNDKGANLSVEVVNVTAREHGLFTYNTGTGSTTVKSTGTVTGTNRSGITALNEENTTDLTLEVHNVTGAEGITAGNEGTGNTSVTSTGTVTATASDAAGIHASNGVNAIDLTVNAVNVTGGNTGINANNNGKGNTSVTATGTVTGTEDHGIEATNGENAVDLTVNAHNVTGGNTGIKATNNGSGDTGVTSTGTVTATKEDSIGIEATNGEEAIDLTVNAVNVTGDQTGINANNNGKGNTTVKSTGTVEGNNTGINVYNGEKTIDLTVEAVNVTGGDTGINANNEGSGNTSITATGTVTGTNNIGIQVGNNENANDLTVQAAAVTGKNRGISAINNGQGDTSITATGTVTVTGEDSVGINVENGDNTNNLTVEAASVTGGYNGIYANNNGKGNTSVTATGTVTGTSSFGINVNNGENTQDLTVEAATVNGAEDGINTLNNGQGDTSITVTGKATGTSYAGIYAKNNENAQSLTVETVAATGALYGIYAENNGRGDTSVKATGMVLGTGEGSTGINAFGGGNTHDLTVEAASVTGADVGINANNEGDGDTSITATGTVIGTNNIGIQVGNNENANDLTVQAVAVTGGQSGIVANNNGRGDTSVNVTGTVTGEEGDGIRVFNNELAQNLAVNAVNVTGSEYGISAQNDGEGDTSVTSTGTVEGKAAHGIVVTNSTKANNLSVNAVNVIGASQGINTNNDGGGNTSIIATGTVTGKGSHGIAASNQSGAGNLSINAVNVTGAGKGISADNFGTGNTSVTATGSVTGQNEEGIYVDNGEDTENLTVNAVKVTGKNIGIYTNNLGSGNTSITTTGTVTGTETDGIVALNGENAIDLTVNTAAVTASKIGITVDNQGSGDTSITATGTVTGTEETGIYAITGSKTQDFTINAVSATGFYEGVYARSTGNGDTNITVTGTATATKENGVGIKAINNANGKNLTVNVANATGGATGVTAYNAGTGTTAINVSGIVEGGDEGISASSSEDQAITITINGTVRNSSQSSADVAIVNGSGAVIINNNQSLLGTVSLGASGNSVNNKGTWDAVGGTSDLGSGTNVLNNQVGGTIRAANAQGTSTTTFNGVGALTQSGSIVLQNKMAGGNTAHVGDVAIFTNGGNGDFQANGGVIYLDTDFDSETSDVLVVDNVTRQGNATMIAVNLTNGINGKQLAGDGIELIDVQGTSVNDAFVLAEPVNVGLFSYDIGQGTQDTQSWFLQTNLRPTAAAAGALSVLGSRTALSTLPGMHDRLREDNPDELLLGQRSGARLVSRDLTLPDAKPQATKGVWGRVFGENSKFQSEEGGGYDAKLWGAQAGLDFYATSNQKGDRQYAGVYIGQASASGDALGGSGLVGSMNVDATTLGAYYTFSSSRGWYVDATAQYSKLSDMKLAAGGDTVRPDGSSYAVSLEAGKVLNKLSKLRTELQAQVIYQKTDVDDVTLNDNTRLTLGGLNTTTGRVGVRLSKNPQYAGRFQPWLRANLWHTLNDEATVSSMGATAGTAIGGTSGEVQVGFALTPSQSSSWSAYAAAGYTFDLSGAQYSGWKGSLGLRKGW